MSVVVAGRAPATVPTSDLGALDVHAHAMPLPLLQRLADRDLADLDEVRRHRAARPAGQRCRPAGPLPGPVHVRRRRWLSEMDEVGVHRHAVSPPPPFLFASTAEDEKLATDVAVGNDDSDLRRRRPDRLLVSVRSRSAGPAPPRRPEALDDLGMAGIAIGNAAAAVDLDDPVNDDLWALLSERRTSGLPASSGVPDLQRQKDFWLPARGLPDGDRPV